MSAPANKDETPINGKSDLINYIASGETPKDKWLIGAEHEKFLVHKGSKKPLAFHGYENGEQVGIEDILKSAMQKGIEKGRPFTPFYEDGKLIALKCPNNSSLTLEPGGQFELSGAPLENLHQICTETDRHLELMRRVTKELNVQSVGLGYFPELERKDFNWMPKGRYQIMREYMAKKGNLGRDMMLRTCTVQVNLDFADEQDLAVKMRIGAALQPVATALFAASPFSFAKPNGYKSWRANIWHDTDPDRCGIPAILFDDDFGYEKWIDYVLDVPMYFIARPNDKGVDEFIDLSGKSFRDFMAGNLTDKQGRNVGKPTMTDWADHMTTIFPEVRAKKIIEMRGADAGSRDHLCALPAFWVGLLYDDEARGQAWDLIKDWRYEDVMYFYNHVAKMGLETPAPMDRPEIGGLHDVAKKVLEIAHGGLKRRAQLSSMGDDETHFLNPLLDIAKSGQSIADRMLSAYHNEWNKSITPIYDEYEY